MVRPSSSIGSLARGVLMCALAGTLATGSSAIAAPPGTNGKLAFSRDGEIVVVNPDGSGETQLTSNSLPGYGSQDPAWSPDGRMIAFSSGRRPFPGEVYSDTFVMNADGSGRRQLTEANFRVPFVGGPLWSPTGRELALGTAINRIGSGMRVITLEGNPVEDFEHPYPGGHIRHRAWSPDGRQIAYSSTPVVPFEPHRFDIGVHNFADGKSRQLTNTGAENHHPEWSPNGGKIAFASRQDGDDEIVVMNPDGSQPIQLTSNAAGDGAPFWSPDGRRIAFVSDRDGDPEIFVMNADGSGETQLTHNATWDGDVVWSPDGRKLAFVAYGDGDEEIFVLDADGTSQVQITNNAVSDQSPDWGVPTPDAPPRRLDPAIGPSAQDIVDTTGPAIAISRRALRASRGGAVRVRLGCPSGEPAGCSGQLSLASSARVRVSPRRRRKLGLGSKAFRMPGSATATVTVRLSRENRRLLQRRGQLRVTATARAADQAGNTRTTAASFLLKAPARRR